MELSILQQVAAFYEARPYPPVSLLSPLFLKIRRDDLPLLNYQAGFAACFGSIEGSKQRPKILVAGAGTCEAIAVAYANPGAEILAVDLSAQSLKKLNWLAKCRGLQIETKVADLESLSGNFDYIIATGVLHHLENPSRGLNHLKSLGHEQTVFRFMIYNKWGRDLLYKTKALASLMGVKEPRALRKMIFSLPDSHPYKMYFHLYSDTSTDSGLCDGYLHPCDQAYEASNLRDLLAASEIEVRKFLHRPEGQPENYLEFAHRSVWERLSLLELYGDLEENYCFFAARGQKIEGSSTDNYSWNAALPAKGNFKSRLLGEELRFQKIEIQKLDPVLKMKLIEAYFLLPGKI